MHTTTAHTDLIAIRDALQDARQRHHADDSFDREPIPSILMLLDMAIMGACPHGRDSWHVVRTTDLGEGIAPTATFRCSQCRAETRGEAPG